MQNIQRRIKSLRNQQEKQRAKILEANANIDYLECKIVELRSICDHNLVEIERKDARMCTYCGEMVPYICACGNVGSPDPRQRNGKILCPTCFRQRYFG